MTLESLAFLGLLHFDHELLHQTIQVQKTSLGPKHPDALRSMFYLARLLSNDAGPQSEAEQLCLEVIDLQLEVCGEKHLDIGKRMNLLAGLLYKLGRIPDARFRYDVTITHSP